MDLKKHSLLGHSPPYLPDEDIFFLPGSESVVWNGLTFATPPLSPVDTATSDKEVITHLSNNELPDELFSNAREASCTMGRADSPAILNDIMWNAGHRTKRPDSAMDIDVRFHLNSTPIAFEQPIANTFVDSEELFSLSLLASHEDDDNGDNNGSNSSRHDENTASSPFQDLSDSDEEIDVVSIQTYPKKENNKLRGIKCIPTTTNVTEQSTISKHVEATRLKPKITLHKSKGKKEDSSASDSDGENTRISHNDLERKRRNELRNRFTALRESIPSLMNNEKAAKITILQKAYELVITAEKEEKRLVKEKDLERQTNAELMRKIVKLTRASKRR